MVKNSRDGNRERAARRRDGLATRGVEQFQIIAPPEAKPLLREAARLMTRGKDPLDPRAALRRAGGGNEPDITEEPADLLAELEEARNRVAKAEAEAEQRRVEVEAAEAREQALKDALKAARAAVISEREFGDMSRTLLADFEAHTKSKEAALQAELAAAKVAETARQEEAQGATKAAQEAQGRATAALQRAEKVEGAIRQVKAMSGIKGWLVRLLAGDVLPD
ncbi:MULTISPECIES: hypothetical protein [Acidiphilium]|nr:MULTISPECIES: hypothetical protein [Acidiphilium]